MPKKTTRTTKPAEQHNEIRIKESEKEEYFRPQQDPYVLPPELNMTIKDGFRFGLGFILAMLLFYALVAAGVAAVLKFGPLIG